MSYKALTSCRDINVERYIHIQNLDRQIGRSIMHLNILCADVLTLDEFAVVGYVVS